MAKRKRNPTGTDLLLYAGVGLAVGILTKGNRLGSAAAPAVLAVAQGKQGDAVAAALAGFGGGLLSGAVGQPPSRSLEVWPRIWTEGEPPRKPREERRV